jgi:outer membrane protein TolC
VVLTLVISALVGCRANRGLREVTNASLRSVVQGCEIAADPPVSLTIERPELCSTGTEGEGPEAAPPLVRTSEMPTEFWELTIDEALQIGLANSQMIRSLGGRILANPDAEPSYFDPALQESDPIFGAQAALSQFDARIDGSLTYAKNDDVFNNPTLGGGANEIQQDLTNLNWTIEKTSATGTRFAWNSSFRLDSNNAPNNLFDSAWTTLAEASIRHPLMQGRGLEFNRIAGPNSQPGFRTSTGILISRINHDISLGQFEAGVRQYVQDLVNAYWDLHFAYRNYDAAQRARQTAAETWRLVKARYDNDLPGGEADKEAQTREQFFLFDLQVESALNGDPRRGITGVLQSEANLRQLLGLPQSDDRFIRPSDAPLTARCTYDWNELVDFALENRVDLNTQRWRIKRRELELVAAKNFLMPRLDALVTVRNNGFGDRLAGGQARFSSAATDFFSSDHMEWQAGFEFNAALGYRQAFAAVRNAELSLMRERAVLTEQRQQVVFELGNALRRLERAYNAMQIAYNRELAARQTVEARTAAFEAETAAADQLLDAQQRLAEAESEYYRTQTDYAIAQLSVQNETGVVLAQFGLSLAEEANEICGSADSRRRWQNARNTGRVDYRLACPGYVAR